MRLQSGSMRRALSVSGVVIIAKLGESCYIPLSKVVLAGVNLG